jgi:hypothetical protein
MLKRKSVVQFFTGVDARTLLAGSVFIHLTIFMSLFHRDNISRFQVGISIHSQSSSCRWWQERMVQVKRYKPGVQRIQNWECANAANRAS